MFPCYEAFIPIIDGMVNQYSKFLKMSKEEAPWREPPAGLNYLLTSVGWRQDHNGYSHQMPGFINSMLNRKEDTARVYLPPDANTLLATMEKVHQSTRTINLVIASKHPLPQWLSMDEAREHVEKGATAWQWASTEIGDPDIVLAGCGTIPVIELLAAADLLRKHAPELRVRFVGVTDLFTLARPEAHPNGMDDAAFAELYTEDKPVLFNFHGYASAVHQLIHRRPGAGALQRSRLRGGGDDDHAVRAARDERSRPLPARHRRAPAGGRGRLGGRPRHVRGVRLGEAREHPGDDHGADQGARAAPRVRGGRGQRPAGDPRVDLAGRRAPARERRLARSVYVTALEPESGKSVVALGLVEMLSARAERIGFFRPVVPSDVDHDPQIELIRDRYEVEAQGVLTDAEAQSMIAAGDAAEVEKRVMEAYRELEKRCEVVVCEGTDFTGAAPALDFDLNARLANALDSPVLVVVRGGSRRRGHGSREGGSRIARAEGLRVVRRDRGPGAGRGRRERGRRGGAAEPESRPSTCWSNSRSWPARPWGRWRRRSTRSSWSERPRDSSARSGRCGWRR